MKTKLYLCTAAITTTALLVIPAVHADNPDQQFLNLVHSNNIAAQDDTLIAFAHEYCDNQQWMASGPALLGQGVGPAQIYQIKVAASRIYCPDKIPIPAGPPNVYHGGNLN